MSVVLVASDAAADVDVIRRVLKKEGFETKACADPARLAAAFELTRPGVLVLAFKSMEAAERHYLALYRHSQVVNGLPHRTLVLCQMEHARDAYERCRSGVFDDYVSFWPLAHDGWLLPKAVHLALRALEGQQHAAAVSQFAAQARRIAVLEAMLDAQVAVGLQYTDALSRAGQAAQADVGAALKGLGQSIVDNGLDEAVVVRDANLVHQALDRINRQSVRPALDQVTEALTPVRQWAGGLKSELAEPIDAARNLAHQAQGLRPKVLVVDDDRLISRALEQVLSKAGCDVQIACDAEQAMHALRRDALDLALLDVGLPDISGIELLRRMKANPRLSDVPVLMLTGHSEKETIVESKAAGAADFVVKPFARELLLKKIDRLLGRPGQTSAQ